MSKMTLEKLNKQVIRCKKCPRLYSYTRHVAATKVKRFSSDKYWGRPLPSFGNIHARILLVGLAPAAHGGNRTGRMFTGDSSGDWVAKVLFENNLASQPTSDSSNDGFTLSDCYITATVRCAPPKNKPTKEEINACSDYLARELSLLEDVQVIICLGRIAFDAVSKLLGIKNARFSHSQLITHDKFFVLCSYHPSKQNTQTGRLTWKQWNGIFVKAKQLIKKNDLN